MLITVDVQPLQ